MNVTRLVVLAACAALFVAFVLPLRDTIVDDTYIHLQYARNLAERGELSFNAGDPTYGATSPLWVFMLAAIDRAGGDTLFWCRALSWLFMLLTILLLYRFTTFIDGGSQAAAAAAFIAASEAWMLRWTAVGMETSFAVFMVLAALWFSFRAVRSARRSALFGFFLFLAFLSRPEAALLVPLACIVFAASRKADRRARWMWGAVLVPLVVIWLLVIKSHTGTFLPLTAGAKQGKLIFSGEVFRRAVVPLKIMGATIALPWIMIVLGVLLGLLLERSPLSFFCRRSSGGPGRDGVENASDSGTEKGMPAASLPDGPFRDGVEQTAEEPSASSLPDRGAAGCALSLLWIAALPVMYVVFDFQVLSRYLLPVTPPAIALGAVAFRRMVSRVVKNPYRGRAVMFLFTCLVIFQSILFYSHIVVAPTKKFSGGLKEVVVGMGEWLRDNSDRDAVVAALDIGAIGYVSERRILDLGGLVTPEMGRMRKRIDVERIVEEGLYLRFAPDFLLDRSDRPERFAGRVIKGYRFETVAKGIVPNLGIRKPDPVMYVLYRLERVEAGAGVEE